MEDNDEELVNLAPMRVRRDSVQSTIADYLAHEAKNCSQSDLLESDGMIDGINVSAYFEPSSTSELVAGENSDDVEFNEPLERFMRNEIAYNEFMQMTGGVGLDEEEAGYDFSEDSDHKKSRTQLAPQSETAEIGVENEAGDDGYDDFVADLPETSFIGELSISKIAPHERSLEEVDEDRLLGIPLELRNSESFGETVPGAKLVGFGGERRMKTDKTLDALIGQANVIYAKGQTKEALTMLQEVIRQEPRNPEPYRQKSLQYGLLAAHLNGNRTSAVEWADLGDYALKLDKSEEAAACYGRAVRTDPSNHVYYEKRIDALEKAGLNVLAMRTRFMAAQSVDRGQVDFEWFRNMITIVADHYIKMNDEEKAVAALETFVLRSREYNRDATEQHKTVVRLLMNSHRFEDAAKSIFALCPEITALDEMGRFAVEIKYNNASYTVKPFPPEKVHRFLVGGSLPTVLLARLAVCFIRLGRKDLAPTLIDKLFERMIFPEDQQVYLDIARAYHAVDCVAHAQKYMEHLLARPYFLDIAEAWYLYGLFLSIRKRYEGACKAYQHALDLQPSHVDARINYSTIQQHLGMVDEAFETLREYVLDAGSTLPDERLLVRQANFLFERKRMDEFARCVRMLLAPHFYEIYLNNMALLKKRLPVSERGTIYHGIRVQAFNAVRGSAFEKYVKRVGQLAAAEERAPSEITGTQLHDYCFKLLETLLQQKRCLDALHVCCFAYLQPLISKNVKTLETFQNLLLYCSIRAQVWPLAFEYLRWFYTLSLNNNLLLPSDRDLLFTRIFNAMNFVFCHSQNVSYHRYIMRALARSPGHLALQMISGNNSLITGAYRHALGEYLHIWKLFPDNPLVCMLIGLTFVHMSCKKDIFSRHMIALRGLAFMNRYQQLRGDNQETYYNVGRMFHQMNILPLAMYFYGKCLKADIPKIVVTDEVTGNERTVEAEEYNLQPMAAHNLALIYLASGNHYVARNLLERYCCVE
ncbi:TPR Domain containing protein [Loa loa]|uniref:TPR Domain containing protein n=1 Tax=Loa loa TaxID=7209 RepID=A0A1S0UEI8_LOALO|nr:TPR Domain containing protein [Loa loa]EJD73995.1 TPR Domain containing protein [Loa loa]